MGVEDNAASERKANKREKAKQSRSRRAGASGGVNWSHFQWGNVVALTEALCTVGGAVRLGQTRDGGAWALGLYLGEDYATEYIRPNEDFEEAVREIAAAWLPKEALQYYIRRVNELNGR